MTEEVETSRSGPRRPSRAAARRRRRARSRRRAAGTVLVIVGLAVIGMGAYQRWGATVPVEPVVRNNVVVRSTTTSTTASTSTTSAPATTIPTPEPTVASVDG